MRAIITTEATCKIGERQLRRRPQRIECRIDDAELRLRADPVVVIAVISIHQHQPDIARVILIRRPLSDAGMSNVTPRVGVEERVIGRHCRQWLIPCRGVVQAGLGDVPARQAAIDTAPFRM